MAEQNTGKITQIIGAVMDIKFSQGKIPEINEAIKVPLEDGGTLTVEVAQDLGDDTVRCIAMGPTDGLVRGMEAQATGGPISVPVGEATLGRIFNVLGDPIDNKPAPEGANRLPIHRKAPEFSEQSTETEVLETGIKVVDLLCPYQKGGKIRSEERRVGKECRSRSGRWCGSRKNRTDPGADPKYRNRAWWIFCIHWCRRTYS